MVRRYRSHDEDSGRWQAIRLREGDIVVSTRSKHGTTWVQTILLLLIHQQPVPPAPLAEIAPWVDHLVEPIDEVAARLAAQPHRRVMKTHTPLDGVPLDPRVTYVVVARHPLDAAESLYHHSANIDRQRLRQLTGNREQAPDRPRLPVAAWLRAWVQADADPTEALDSLPGVFWHLSDAWRRRGDSNVVLVHFDDLLADLDGQMRRLAQHLGIGVEARRWPFLVAAATFRRMQQRADVLAPNRQGLLRDNAAFFRAGVSGGGAALLDAATRARYAERAQELAPPDLLAWLHR